MDLVGPYARWAMQSFSARDTSKSARSCAAVKIDGYSCKQIQVAKVVQLRANVEGLRLRPGDLERMVEEGRRGSMR
ncbi:hypothetical protein OG21DRAFT_1038163 [Imleria badia]|nr:hypothetical protein OG21DRAFT_1038163 [Imleria badia]